MFESFRSKYQLDYSVGCGDVAAAQLPRAQGLRELMSLFSGASFNSGQYRIHRFEDLETWNKLITDAFPDFRGRTFCFGYDWLGTHFAIDLRRMSNGEPLVLMFEAGTGEALEVPETVESFHERGLIEMPDAILATDFFNQWREQSRATLDHAQCAGYRVPLFLGGKDEVENLEVCDLRVYWDLTGQLLAQIRALPIGTTIDKVGIKK